MSDLATHSNEATLPPTTRQPSHVDDRVDRGPSALLSAVLPALTLAVVAAAFVRFLSLPFLGSDTWPWLASSRVSTLAGLVTLVSSPIMSGTEFVSQVAVFYHPVTALSYALDLDLFGLNPTAFNATNLVIHLLTVGALYSLARGLGLSPWSAALAGLVFGLHPIADAAVPSLPRRQDLLVGLFLVTSASLLVRSRLGSGQPRRGLIAVALVVYLLALGAKETAYVGLLILPFVLACAALGGGRAVPKRHALSGAVVVFVIFAVVQGLAFALRWRVMGGIGGYFGAEAYRASLSDTLQVYTRAFVTDLLWPVHALLPDKLSVWLVVVGLLCALIVLAAARLRPRYRMVVILGCAWLVSFLVFYVVLRNAVSAYLLYGAVVGLALLLAGLAEGGITALLPVLRARQARERRVLLSGLPVALAALGSMLVALAVVVSPLTSGYTEWSDAGRASAGFIAQALPCLTAAPAGTAVAIDNLPHHLDYGMAESQFLDVYVFEAYSVDAMLQVLAPGTHLSVHVQSLADLHQPATSIQVTCTPSAGQLDVTTTLSS